MTTASREGFNPVSMYYMNAPGGLQRPGGSPQRARSPARSSKTPAYYEFLHKPNLVRPASRPIKQQPSKKNAETFDVQEQRDAIAFAKRAAACHKPEYQKYHNCRPFDQAPRQVADDCVTDRGRRKAQWCSSSLMFDPIAQEARPVEGRVEMRPGSAPPTRPTSPNVVRAQPWPPNASGRALKGAPLQPKFVDERAPSGRRPGTAAGEQGRYNPLTHEWVQEPPLQLLVARQRVFDRKHGVCHGVGTLATLGTGSTQQQQTLELREPGTFVYSTPALSITGSSSCVTSWDGQAIATASSSTAGATAATPVPGSPVAPRKASTSSSPGGSSTVQGGMPRWHHHSSSNSGILSGYGGEEQLSAASVERRKSGLRQIVNGNTWGQYDPIRHEWKVPPSNPVYQNQHEVHDKHFFTTGTHSKRVEHVQAKGVWNPISATWTIPPKRSSQRPASSCA